MLIKNAPTQDVFIHRHCMQELLHEAITNDQNQCRGLLTGFGNIVTTCFPVTQKLLPRNTSTSVANHSPPFFGVYLATDNSGAIHQNELTHINTICLQHHKQMPSYYLILYLDHKGRIDARMYTDATLKTSVTLHMQEA